MLKRLHNSTREGQRLAQEALKEKLRKMPQRRKKRHRIWIKDGTPAEIARAQYLRRAMRRQLKEDRALTERVRAANRSDNA